MTLPMFKHGIHFADLAKNLALILGILFACKLLEVVSFKVARFNLKKVFPKVSGKIDLQKRISYRLYFFLVTVTTYACLPFFYCSEVIRGYLGYLLLPLSIIACLNLAVCFVKSLGKVLKIHFDYSDADNLQLRSIYTQIQFIEKIIVIVIWIMAFVAFLFSFNGGRQLGKSVLASAGVLGIVIGLAAQKSLTNLLAGFQIAFTQPIRLDDVVIVENKWGRIEEITFTYVVVCLWDLKRLILPINYFNENPFENWTRRSSEILPFILIHTDYSLPLEPLREKFTAFVKESTLWNGKLAKMQVIDCAERTMVIRGLMSAANASLAFDLQCEIREKMMAFLASEYPEHLSKIRMSSELAYPEQFELSHTKDGRSNAAEVARA